MININGDKGTYTQQEVCRMLQQNDIKFRLVYGKLQDSQSTRETLTAETGEELLKVKEGGE